MLPVETNSTASKNVERESATPTFVHELAPARQVKAVNRKS
jgi:hypothetical protein